MLIIFSTLLPFLQAGAVPLSFGAETAPTIVHTIVWGLESRNDCSGPATRTLYQIVRSCAFTIAACVYRAVHQNIPDPKASKWKRTWLRLKIALYALVVPELMVAWALRQRIGAKTIADQVNQLVPELQWTLTHGHFAQMGGFGRMDEAGPGPVLYPNRLIELLKNGQLDIMELRTISSQKIIEDKSKGDIISKGLVVFQTTWFVFECLARLQQKLSITELEVVTLAFATLNFLTYLLWWHKPLDVLCPIYLHILPPREVDAVEPVPVAPPPDSIEKETETRSAAGMAMHKIVGKIAASAKAAWHGVCSQVVAIKRELKRNGWWRSIWKWLIKKPFTALMWPFVAQLIDSDEAEESTHVSTFYAMEGNGAGFEATQTLCWFIGTVFGGIHFLSWNANFPTHTQQLLWRGSSIVLGGEPFLLLLSATFQVGISQVRMRSEFGSELLHTVSLLFSLIVGFISGPGLIPYIPARFCVFALAILTLNHLPPDAFQTVSWTSYIPHL
ncbi:hypothetical protein BDN72DRAFT_280572 [Pluteus cervinus]|uniref:Uncharacterized protein n=1 Tax=Pluteus cervinus TaxID=181527 RepID=A0ACD3AFL4_9AGAR|nr:hypothetical protein BDN72DRAFT_280572 [Pluteus cervinus]